MKRTELPRSSVPLQRKTPMRSTNAGPRRTQAKPKRPRDTGPSDAVVIQVAQRDEWACFRCGGACHGRRGIDWSVQHRRARGMGGTRRADTNQPQALILLCGSATSPGGCHLRVEERHPEDAGCGWSIKQTEDPLLVPVLHWERGFIYLFADGGFGSRPLTFSAQTSLGGNP